MAAIAIWKWMYENEAMVKACDYFVGWI
jgi:hypothetical protein